MLGLTASRTRLRRIGRIVGFAIFGIGLIGFGLRLAQQSGYITIDLEPDRVRTECEVLERALREGRLNPIDVIAAGCSSTRVRKILVDREAGHKFENAVD